jgi:hypothetical protein
MKEQAVGLWALLAVVGCGASPEFAEDPEYASEAEVSTPAPAATRIAGGSLLGRWSGTGYQSSGSSWEMVLDIARTDEGPCAIVDYPDVGCAGYWTCVGRSDGNGLEAVEHITTGKKRCVDRVEVRVKLVEGSRLAFMAQAEDQTAEATLAPTR